MFRKELKGPTTCLVGSGMSVVLDSTENDYAEKGTGAAEKQERQSGPSSVTPEAAGSSPVSSATISVTYRYTQFQKYIFIPSFIPLNCVLWFRGGRAH